MQLRGAPHLRACGPLSHSSIIADLRGDRGAFGSCLDPSPRRHSSLSHIRHSPGMLRLRSLPGLLFTTLALLGSAMQSASKYKQSLLHHCRNERKSAAIHVRVQAHLSLSALKDKRTLLYKCKCTSALSSIDVRVQAHSPISIKEYKRTLLYQSQSTSALPMQKYKRTLRYQ